LKKGMRAGYGITGVGARGGGASMGRPAKTLPGGRNGRGPNMAGGASLRNNLAKRVKHHPHL